MQNIEDAIDELVLVDEDEKIMYREGEIFLYKPVSSAQVNVGALNEMCSWIELCLLACKYINLYLFAMSENWKVSHCPNVMR